MPLHPEQTLTHFLTHFTYAGVFLALLSSGFGVPIPEDIPLLLAGAMCSPHLAGFYLDVDPLKLWLMVPLCYLAVVGGDLTIFFVGRHFGRRIPNLSLIRRVLTPHRLARAEAAFCRHGGKALMVARFLPGLRMPTFFTAGAFRVPRWKMLACDGGAAVLSVPAWIFVGYMFGESLDTIVHYFRWIGLGAAVLVVATLVAYVIYRHRRYRAPA
jgi:membrane protein DedA with SNARE-associated domain